MKLIKPSFEIIEQLPGLEGIYKIIEQAGRTCYKSFDKIIEDSAESFVNRMMSNHHLSVLEHGTVYLKVDSLKDRNDYRDIYDKYKANPYSKVLVARGFMSNRLYITSNYRVLVEHNWLDDLKYLCEPTEFYKKRVTVRMICSIGTSREFNRHRASSISEQSTRYCNFSKDKFGNEVSFIIPCWLNLPEGHIESEECVNLGNNEKMFLENLFLSEMRYLKLIKEGWQPQQAREVLPLATATEVVYTAYISDWIHFFRLRCNEAAHPSARELAIPLKEGFIKRGYINEKNE